MPDKRINLVLQPSLYKSVKLEAKRRDMASSRFIRQCIKWGLATMPQELIAIPKESTEGEGHE